MALHLFYSPAGQIEELRGKLRGKEEELQKLNDKLQRQEGELEKLKKQLALRNNYVTQPCTPGDLPKLEKSTLLKDEIERYSRQLILPEIGVEGQLALRRSSVLVVGAGGLGCPASVFLAAAGVGRLGVIDYDVVETSNLHRQILHTQDRIGTPKASSVQAAITSLNSHVDVVPYQLSLNSSNALQIISQYDIVLDATDNVATRYLLSDACVLTGKSLVSGSALRFEGQLTVYNHSGGPCYRCLYPVPPPPGTVTNCSDGGVLGVVPGIIGSMQALEAIKLLIGLEVSYSEKMLLFDGLDGSYRTIRLRAKQQSCCVCGENPILKSLIDYEQFCGSGATDKAASLSLLDSSERISVQEYKQLLDRTTRHILLDVRVPAECSICSLPDTTNIPLAELQKQAGVERLKQVIQEKEVVGEKLPVYVICRRGNDSQRAVAALKPHLMHLCTALQDIRGGLHAWAREIEPTFPVY